MFDIIAMGELVVDLIDNSAGVEGFSFRGTAGGAPCNVLAQAAKLGLRCAFTGCVGDDLFGRYLTDYITRLGVDTSHVYQTKKANTTLAFVKHDQHRDRQFSFYRNPGADMMYEPSLIDTDFMKACRIFHFGTVSLSKEPARSATFEILERLKSENVRISYDPNFRFFMWDSEEEARTVALKALKYCDILKLSEEELVFMSGETAIEKGIEKLKRDNQFILALVTLGQHGCRYFYKNTSGAADAFKVDAKDTTAAGDSFLGAFLSKVIQYDLNDLSDSVLHDAVTYANAAGAVTASQEGSINVLPDDKTIRELMQGREMDGQDRV